MHQTYYIYSECGDDEVRLEVAYCGICGSDIHEYLAGPIVAPPQGTKNRWTGEELPVVMGHEISGTIVEVGSGANTVKVGQRVAVNPQWDDRHHQKEPCVYCRTGKSNICKRFATYGFSAPGGGFCSQIVVKERNCLLLPEELPLAVGALTEPLAVACHTLRLSGFRAGQDVLILGAGPIGLMIVMVLRIWGANKILVSEISHLRSEKARQFGATEVVNPSQNAKIDSHTLADDPVLEVVRVHTEDGVDLAVETSGLQSTMDTAVAATRPAGTIFNVAVQEKPLLLDFSNISCFEKKVFGGMACTQEDFDQALNLMRSGKLPLAELISAVVPLDRAIEDGLDELVKNSDHHIKILVQPTCK